MTAKKNAKQTQVQTSEKDEQVKASAEVEKKITALGKRTAERILYYEGTIEKHEAHVVAAHAKIEKLTATLEKRAISLRAKGDPKTKKQLAISKLQAKMAKLQADLDAMD